MCKIFFKEECCSTFEAMAGLLDRAVRVLVDRQWIAPKEEPCLRLCLEEALVNAIRHGNRSEARRKVRLEIAEWHEGFKIKVHDEGNGFCPERVQVPRPEVLGGRGICLIRHFMDQVQFNQEEHCLEMTFSRKAVQPEESPTGICGPAETATPSKRHPGEKRDESAAKDGEISGDA